jgi:hypothetical protein
MAETAVRVERLGNQPSFFWAPEIQMTAAVDTLASAGADPFLGTRKIQ